MLHAATTAWPPRDHRHLLVSGSQMAALEEQLFASGLPVEALMEKAALAVTRRLLADYGAQLERGGAVVLVGPGHNGGDGLVIARELHLAGIRTAIWSPLERHKPLTAAHLRHALWLGIPRLTQPPEPGGPQLWIDALLGIGQRRPPGDVIEALLEQRQQQRPGALVAVDVPTGLCSDTGRATGAVVASAATTYAIGLIKSGLIQDQALATVGRLELIELGLPASLLETLPPEQPLGLGAGDLAERPRPWLDPSASKYQRGRLLLVAGSPAYPGAASLALAGAGSSGCGSLQAALPPNLAGPLWQQHPHVVVNQTLGASGAGGLNLNALAALDRQRLDAVLVGPGIGTTEANAAADAELAAWQRLQSWPGLLVLDADGLNRLAGPVATALDLSACTWLQQRQGPTWITPHPGEFARLFPALTGERATTPALPPLEAASEAARLSGASVLLKGARSVVAAADGRRWQLLEASPHCARAGLGDVLAGYAAGLGAMALAASGEADASWLAAAALSHAQAGLRCSQQQQRSGCTPMAVAQELAAEA